MNSQGLKDPWSQRQNVTDSINISDTYEVAVNFGFFRFNRRWTRNHSNRSGMSNRSFPKPIEQQSHPLKSHFHKWKKTFQRCVQVVQTTNAIRLVLFVFIPFILEYIRNR